MHMNSSLGALPKKEFRARVAAVRAQFIEARKAGLATRAEQIKAVRETRRMLRTATNGSAAPPGSTLPPGAPAAAPATPPIVAWPGGGGGGGGGGGYGFDPQPAAVNGAAKQNWLLPAALAAAYFLL